MRRHEATSFDQSISPRDESRLHFDAERLGRFQINDEFEYRRPLDRQLGRVPSLQNAIGIVGKAPMGFRKLWRRCMSNPALEKVS